MRVHLELFAAELLVDLDLDGQAVAVPAGDVGGVEAGHGLGLDDEVLDALVERVAEVDGTVGVGRAVVQDVLGRAGAGAADLVVEVAVLPAARRSGSFGGRFAFMGNSVFGSLRVALSSGGADIVSPVGVGKRILYLLRSGWLRCGSL